jgi:hypothetical protein
MLFSLLYAESVLTKAQGRDAWRAHPGVRFITASQPCKGCYSYNNPCRVGEQISSTQGAVAEPRDPGLGYITPSAYRRELGSGSSLEIIVEGFLSHRVGPSIITHLEECIGIAKAPRLLIARAALSFGAASSSSSESAAIHPDISTMGTPGPGWAAPPAR